ncbi:hypothetical protein SPHINGOT1_390016 [Sphingomonas sp. T1]|nr:hypothetical protein SPHINGOT1_390016 [Sphingomonas sp. T1]
MVASTRNVLRVEWRRGRSRDAKKWRVLSNSAALARFPSDCFRQNLSGL